MTKHEADVIGGLNMTDQISNEAYKQIMIAAQEENEVGDTLDKIRAEIENEKHIGFTPQDFADGLDLALEIIDKYKAERSEE